MDIQNSISEARTVYELMEKNFHLQSQVKYAVEVLINSFSNNGKVLFCGNGGSAADAQHLAAELSGRFYKNRKALHAEALHQNTSYLTAVANDYSFDVVYERLIDGIGQPNDVLFALTTSGNSVNIIKAVEKANEIGMYTIVLTGKSGGSIARIGKLIINVPSDNVPRIQEGHMLIGHIICKLVEEKLFP
jgi:D-sedoheptulose 7-phosphate isomerase